MKNAVDRRSIRELLAAITCDLLLLGKQLLGMARAEGRVAVDAARGGAAVATVGLGLVVCGVLTLVSALVLALVALGLSPWASALLVGVSLTFGGAVAIHVGVDTIRHVRLHFPETRATISEGVAWLKNLER